MESPMDDELTECYNLLGLSPGASSAELKAAHRDLAKVWHPDRFLHDPRLQEKAQEKIKKINEAYDQLLSRKAKRQKPPSASTRERYAPPMRSHFDQHAPRIRWRLRSVPSTAVKALRSTRTTSQGLATQPARAALPARSLSRPSTCANCSPRRGCP